MDIYIKSKLEKLSKDYTEFDNQKKSLLDGLKNAKTPEQIAKLSRVILYLENRLQEIVQAQSQLSSLKQEPFPLNQITNLLDKARIYFRQLNYEESKLCFEQYLDSISVKVSNLTGREMEYSLIEINDLKNEYIDIIVKYKNLNISESNPIIRKFNVDRMEVFLKICRKEMLTISDISLKRDMYREAKMVHQGNNIYASYIIETIEAHPEEILKEIIEIDYFIVDNIVFLYNQQIRNEELFYDAIEHNLIKKYILERCGISFVETSFYDDPNYNDPINDSDLLLSQETPQDYGYSSWAEMELGEVWEGNIDEYNAHND